MLACVVAIYSFDNYNDKVWTFFILLGCLIYTLGIYFLESNFILNTQFFRMTIWIKFWGSIVLMRALLNYLEKNNLFQFIETHFKKIIFSLGIICALIMLPAFRIFKNKDYMFPFFKNADAFVEISEHAKKSTPSDALFITPPDFEAFRFYSQRSNFIDYKAILHDNAYLLEWQKRMRLVYNVGTDNSEKGFHLLPIAKAHFNTLSDSAMIQLCVQNHIGYVIRENGFPLQMGFNKIDSTAYYSIYKL
jgi:hypothetical protein